MELSTAPIMFNSHRHQINGDQVKEVRNLQTHLIFMYATYN